MPKKYKKNLQSSRKPTPLAPIAPDLQSEFINLANRLSPENLTCDGECSKTEVKARSRIIYREWRALEKQAGRRVSETEVDDWWIELIDTGVSHAV